MQEEGMKGAGRGNETHNNPLKPFIGAEYNSYNNLVHVDLFKIHLLTDVFGLVKSLNPLTTYVRSMKVYRSYIDPLIAVCRGVGFRRFGYRMGKGSI